MALPLRRRAFLLAGGSTVLSFAGCLGSPIASHPHSFTLTITQSGDDLEMAVDPAGEVEDVIQVHVGDTIDFTVVNRAGVPVGFHNHADDAEVVIESGGERTLTFEATEAMTGRHELEGWVAEDDGDAGHGGHGEDATVLAIVEVRPPGS